MRPQRLVRELPTQNCAGHRLLVALLATLLCHAAAETVAVNAAGATTPASGQGARIAADEMRGRSVDALPNCGELAGSNLSACGEFPELLLSECAATCGTCSYRTLVAEQMSCDDTHAECANWAKAGECDANPKYMLQSCTTSCGVCEQKMRGCARESGPGLVSGSTDGQPNMMEEMFEASLRDYPQYEPTALSTDPYVVQFENLVTADEAKDFIDRCDLNGKFERSLAGDQLSPVRTSTQCWCDEKDGCLAHPTVEKVTRRLLNVTRLPFENAEYFQILKYEEGQFYRAHHDQQTAHWTPQGVRLYTFFLYLSDVEAGGGTRFTDLGITVTPKLGRGILWPSVFGSDLNKSDKRTNHEALPVEKGVKYAANLWQHLYDFKTPSRSGLCVFLGKNSNHA